MDTQSARGEIPILAAAYKKKGGRKWTPRELGIYTLQDQMNNVREIRGHERRDLSLPLMDAINLARDAKNQQPIENYTAIAEWSQKVMHLSALVELQADRITEELRARLKDCIDWHTVMQEIAKQYTKNKEEALKVMYNYTRRKSVYALDHVIGIDYIIEQRRSFVESLDIINAYNATWDAIAECWDAEHVEEVQIDLEPIKMAATTITYHAQYIKLLAKGHPRLYQTIYTNPNIKEALSPWPFYTEPRFCDYYDLKTHVKRLTAFTLPGGDPLKNIKPR